MASRLTLAQLRLADLEAQTQTLIAADPTTVTTEQMTAHATAVTAARQEVAAAQALTDLDRTSTAATLVQAGANANRVPGTVTPNVERDPQRGFSSIGQFAQAVRLQQGMRSGKMAYVQPDERLAVVMAETQAFAAKEAEELGRYSAAPPSTIHREAQSEDGLMVPPDFRTQIWTPAYEADDLLSLFNPETTNSVVVQLLADETTPWGAAGIHAYWVSEGNQLTPSKLSTKPRQVTLHKIAAMVLTTDELLQDTSLLTSRINEKAPQAIGWTVSEALIRGNGVGKPLGYEDPTYTGTVVVPKETSQKAGSLYTENVLQMAARTLEGPGSRIMWLAHRSVIPYLATLKIGTEPSWTTQNQGLREAPNGMLLGFPMKFSQHAKALGTQGDITLLDFSGYAAFVHSSGTRFDSSIHLYFDFDISAFRWIMRVGGMPYLSAPVSPANGSNTMSHFVQLATR